MDAVRWGFLGAGWIAGRALAPAVHVADGAVLQAVAARDVDRARRLGPAGAAYGDYDALLDDPDVDAVYISLTNEAHAPWTIAALQAGKHVLCEKPLAMDADEVQRMTEAAAAADRLLVEATWSRWHPRTRRAQALLATHALGRVQRVEAGFGFSGVEEGNYRLDPARGGGALYDVGPYALGAALWAVPGEDFDVLEVQVRRNDQGADLTTQISLRIGDVEARVLCSIGEDAGEWVRIVGDAGALSLDDSAHSSWLSPSRLTVTGAEEELLQFAPVDAYQLMVEQVSRRIRGDASAWVLPLTESARVAAAIDAVLAQAH